MPQKNRLERIFENAREAPDVVAISNGGHVDTNFFYISGYRSGLFEGNMLFLFPDRHVEVLTNPLEEEAARQKKDFAIHVERGSGPTERRRMVSSILKGCRRVGINFQGVSHKDFKELETMLGPKKLIDVSDALSKSRMVKDPDELEALSKAAQIISKVVEGVPDLVKEGMTERALKAQIDYQMVDRGADSPSFESIVAFGENSALPHYSAGERRLLKGDNILVDVGARYHLYCSDITRTLFFGRAARTQREAYSKVLEAQTDAIEAIRDGVTGRAVHQVAAKVIDQSRFKGRFTHGLGHSIGLEVHDGEGLSLRNTKRLEQNMVMTVEPGVYLPGEGGVRIEDDVVVTRDSCRPLTRGSKELLEV
ncbi:MAG TPA: Xaa-Pro peptidase family protein [Nitrososphaerales archaeon]|nr:Xaa-Pro peptidase family protein [Nitrososphaerales archaeon]